MKKAMAIILIICVVLSFSVLPVSANEIHTEILRRPLSDEELDNLAAEAFPEYADRILTSQSRYSSYSLQNNEKVIEETRKISDTEYITYIEYADGRSSLIFQVDVYQGSTSSGSNTVTKTVDFQIRHVFMTGSMYISGFKYTIVTGGYDYINSAGTFSCTAENGSRTVYSYQETASGDAEMRCSCIFNMSGFGDFATVSPVPCTFRVIVGNDTISYDAY